MLGEKVYEGKIHKRVVNLFLTAKVNVVGISGIEHFFPLMRGHKVT